MASEGDDSFASFDNVYETFDDMNFKEELLTGIFGYGFWKPSEVQQKGIVPLCKGRDVLVQAESEPGRTVAFCTAILQRHDCDLEECQCIVLASTTDMVQEIARLTRELGAYLDYLKVYACGEGLSIVDDLRCFEHNRVVTKAFHVVVGTPSSVLDMFEGKTLRPNHIKMVVLDDTFEKDQIVKISQLLPSRVQVGVFVETITPAAVEAFHLLRKSDNDKSLPVKIVVKKDVPRFKGMTHYATKVAEFSEKPKFLLEYLHELPTDIKCVVFVNGLNWAHRLLRVIWANVSLRAQVIPSNMGQAYRDMLIREFRAGSINVLITTDHLARGFDIEVPLIINYDMTFVPSVYRKRIARFGRDGGVVINIVHNDGFCDLDLIRDGCDVVFEGFTNNDDFRSRLSTGL